MQYTVILTGVKIIILVRAPAGAPFVVALSKLHLLPA